MRFLALILLIAIDIYAFQAFKAVFKKRKKLVFYSYFIISGLIFLFSLIIALRGAYFNTLIKQIVFTLFLVNYAAKSIICFWLFVDDVRRWIKSSKQRKKAEIQEIAKEKISRSEFLAKTGLVLGSLPVLATTYGVLKGAHDYRVVNTTVPIKNLPKAFEGLKIGHLSDIHSGSFMSKKAVEYGVEMFIKERPDIVFFTGDLVNRKAEEMQDYISIFSKIQADLGVFAILGNHDYGYYHNWKNWTTSYKNKQVQDMQKVHKVLGWNLLLNQNEVLEIDKEKLAVLGVENYSVYSRFPTFGQLKQAQKNTEDCAVKLLLSHDPSHWEDEIYKDFKDIDITFSGHTHGMQAGIEIGSFQWSPIQYMYRQWAGLYQKENQYIYVNRGFGYIGFPARIGMPPELGIIELVRAS